MKSHFTQKVNDARTAKSRQRLKFGVLGFFVLALIAGSFLLASHFTAKKNDELVENVKHRLELVAQGRADVFGTWLTDLTHRGDRLIKSDLFRLYASEVGSIRGDLAPLFGASAVAKEEGGNELAAQLPMMQNIMREFCSYSGFLSARILNGSGVAYLATDGYLPPMKPEALTLSRQAFNSGSPVFSALYLSEYGLLLDIYVPIYPPEGGSGEKPVSVLMMTAQVSGKITEQLSNSVLSAKGEKTRLMQQAAGGLQEIMPWTQEGFAPVTSKIDFTSKGKIDFAVRSSLANDRQRVYSLGVGLAGSSWWIVQEMDFATANAPIETYARTVYILTGFVLLIILLATVLVWWVQAGINSQRSADRFKALAEQIDEQKRFIDSVNSTMKEFITLKDLDGKYIYANEALAEAVGRTKEEIIGMDMEAILGFDTAKRLGISDKNVIERQEQVFINEAIYLQSKLHQFQISKSPWLDSQGVCRGVLEVYRDVSEFVAAQEKHRRLIQRAMEALGSTIEAADPYLGGHTKLMAALTAEVGKTLNLPEAEIVELETAANLSQIGKMFVPREILTKPEKLSAEEKEVMETHVEYAYRMLKNIDIDENVLRAIYQMNERLDGSGYPQRLIGEQIKLSARILSVLNVFCAMVRPRSHRGAMEEERALAILKEGQHQFDQTVVDGLARVLKTPIGERILRG